MSCSEDALLSGSTSGIDVPLDGAPPKMDINEDALSVGADLFSTIHIPVLAGRANDLVKTIGVAVLLILVALIACYVPARRAMRVDPMAALR